MKMAIVGRGLRKQKQALDLKHLLDLTKSLPAIEMGGAGEKVFHIQTSYSDPVKFRQIK